MAASSSFTDISLFHTLAEIKKKHPQKHNSLEWVDAEAQEKRLVLREALLMAAVVA